MDTHSNFAVSGSISSSSLTGDLGIFAVKVSEKERGKNYLMKAVFKVTHTGNDTNHLKKEIKFFTLK